MLSLSTLPVVADVLGVSTNVAVSLQLRRFDQLVAENPKPRSVAPQLSSA
ncbi:MAG: hypothetical protein HN341_11505 [Verrucomicrobia bacterium]|jgi:hypothetical protein|nr:hypothetical protein [Verrucomicrobiota bacterium]